MPLLWKKRNQKIPAPVTVSNEKPADNGLCCVQGVETNGHSETVSDSITFIFVMHNFTGTVSDELSVSRGQLVQQLFVDSSWLYVRNVDGSCGYIPLEFTCSIDDIQKSMGWCSSTPSSIKPKVSSGGILQSRLHSSSAFPYDKLPTSPNVAHHLHSDDVHYDTPTRVCTTDIRNIKSEASAIVDLSASPHAVPRLHPLHPLSLRSSSGRTMSRHESDSVRPMTGSIRPSSGSIRPSTGSARPSSGSVRPSTGSINPSTPAAQPLSVHLRTFSYQEAVTEIQEEETTSRITVKHPCRPHNLPLHPVSCNGQNNCTLTTSIGLQTYTQDSQLDDVFLPSSKKPVGIFKSLTKYDKTVPGEVSLLGNEYLIVTELGRGDWAWVITATGAEGVVPKAILSQYNPNDAEANTVGTQTELIIVAPSSIVSASSSSRSREQPTCATGIIQTEVSRTKEVGIQTEHFSPVIMDMWSQSQTIDDLWYENSMSMPRLNGLSIDGLDSPSICTLPAVNVASNHESGVAPLAFHSSRQSLPQLPALRSMHSRHEPATIDTQLMANHWPASPGINNYDMRPTVGMKPKTVVLKATRSHIPEVEGTEYLSVEQGDILHVYPGNNTVYKGWIWAYHVGQGSYGFVPKSITAFLYLTTCRHENGGITCYDEV